MRFMISGCKGCRDFGQPCSMQSSPRQAFHKISQVSNWYPLLNHILYFSDSIKDSLNGYWSRFIICSISGNVGLSRYLFPTRYTLQVCVMSALVGGLPSPSNKDNIKEILRDKGIVLWWLSWLALSIML